MLRRIGLARLVVTSVALAEVAAPQGNSVGGHGFDDPKVVFVCEHGASLSVISAAYFNQLAKEQHLNLHAVARGTKPQKDISVSAREGLKADGIPLEMKRPQALSPQDASQALRVIAFCPLARKYSRREGVETWNDVPAPSSNYGRARDAILSHVRELIERLKIDDVKR